MMKNRIEKAVTTILIIFAMLLLTPLIASKAADFPFIKLDHYEVSKGKIIPGEKFTLSLYLSNVSETTNAENLVVTVSMPSGISSVYGLTSQEFVRMIEPQTTVKVEFEFESVEELYAYYIDFNVTVIGDESNNSFVLRIPVGTDSPFSISYFSIPTEATEGFNSTATVSFKVIGTDNVKNSHLVAYCNNTEYARSTIGTLSPGITKTHSVSIPFYSSGECEITLYLEYEVVNGKIEKTEIGKASCIVMKLVERPTDVPPAHNQHLDSELNKQTVFGIIGIVLLSVALVVIRTLQKKK